MFGNKFLYLFLLVCMFTSSVKAGGCDSPFALIVKKAAGHFSEDRFIGSYYGDTARDLLTIEQQVCSFPLVNYLDPPVNYQNVLNFCTKQECSCFWHCFVCSERSDINESLHAIADWLLVLVGTECRNNDLSCVPFPTDKKIINSGEVFLMAMAGPYVPSFLVSLEDAKKDFYLLEDKVTYLKEHTGRLLEYYKKQKLLNSQIK